MADDETAGTRFEMSVPVTYEASELVDGLTDDEVFQLVVEIDQQRKWSLTRRLAAHFAELMKADPGDPDRATWEDAK